MKITIRSETEEQESDMELWLEESQDHKSVAIRGNDGRGTSFILARISDKGITLPRYIPLDIGWPLDAGGRLKLVNHD
jgi:hypothetical protein